MEVVNFYPKTFHEIPKQDNPAFGDQECMMIVMSEGYSPNVLVLHIKPDPIESVNSVAKFWREERALKYCEHVEL